jgi:hypothetical protein
LKGVLVYNRLVMVLLRSLVVAVLEILRLYSKAAKWYNVRKSRRTHPRLSGV